MNTEVTGWRRWIPTDKWIASAAAGMASIASSWIATNGFDDVEQGMVATLIPALVAAYFITNKDRSEPVRLRR